MPRVKLKELDNYNFRYEAQVLIHYINMANHVGSVELTEMIQEARYQMMKSIGNYSDLNIDDAGSGAIMTDIVTSFKGEIFIDDTVVIESDISELDSKGYRTFHRVLKDGKVVALSESGYLAYSFIEKKLIDVPAVFIEKYKAAVSKK